MQIATALQAWILDSAARGCLVDDMVAAMVKSGHQAGYAAEAIRSVLGPDWHPRAPEGTGAPQPGKVAVPEPLARPGVPWVDTPDRRVAVLATLQVPRIVAFGGILDRDECEALCALAAPRMARALTVNRETGSSDEHAERVSDGMFFARGEHPLVQKVERRIAALMNWPVENGEGLQVLRYGPGGEYRPHYDYFDPTDPGSEPHIARGGNRVATLVVYLRAPEEGGGTLFPDIGFEVAPVAGNGVFFSYDIPSPDSLTLHAGTPVVRGEKWIATKWVRSRRYESAS